MMIDIYGISKNITQRAHNILQLAIVAFLALYAILRWLNTFNLAEDGTNYITAALNFVKTGKLFIFVNWPSYSGEPLMWRLNMPAIKHASLLST